MKKIDYNTYQKPSSFARFAQGDTKVLIVSSGVICYEHGMRAGGRFVPLGVCSETSACEQCQKGNDPKLKYKWIVYLPEIGEVRVMSVGPQIGDEVCVIGKQLSEGKEQQDDLFEVVINRTGIGIKTSYKVKKSNKPAVISPQTAIFIKQSRDYLFRKYLT